MSIHRKPKKGWFILAVALLAIFFRPSPANAGELNIALEPEFPENQVNTEVPYYDLRVTPGQKQTIYVKATNLSDEDLTLLSYVTNATTSEGIIDYKAVNAPLNETLKHPFTEMAHVEEKTTLAPKEEKKIPIEIDVPAESFDGMVLGGLYFKQEEGKENAKEETEKEGAGSMGINNKFSFMVSVKLTESDHFLSPNLDLLEGKAGQAFGRTVVQANLQNPEPAVLEGLEVSAKVFKKGSKTALYKKESEGLRLAPNSNFWYDIPVKAMKNGKEKSVAIQPGVYELEIEAANADDSWQFKTEFEVTKAEADKLNKESVDELEEAPNYLLWIGLGVGVVLVLVAIIVVVSRMKKKKERLEKQKQMERRKKKKAAAKKNGQKKAADMTKKKSRKPYEKE